MGSSPIEGSSYQPCVGVVTTARKSWFAFLSLPFSIKAITSDFGSENVCSIQARATNTCGVEK